MRRLRYIAARAVLCAGMSLFVAFSLGCMALSFGGRTEVVSPESQASADGIQRGKAFVPAKQDICIYYPVPFVSPPNLEFEGSDKQYIQIVEQKPTHFRVANNSPWNVDCPWKARGLTVTAAKASAPTAVTPTGATLAAPQTQGQAEPPTP